MNHNNNRLPPFYKVCIFIVALQPFLLASANVNPMAAIDAQEQSRHQERERAFQEQIFPKEDIRLARPSVSLPWQYQFSVKV